MAVENWKLMKILDLGIEIAGVKDIDVLLERILRGARHLVNADAGSIYIKEGRSLKFSHTQNDTLQSNLPPGRKLVYSTFSIPISNDSISGYVAATGETLNIPDVYELSEEYPFSFNKYYDRVSGYRTQSVITFPLRTTRGEVVGVLQLINCKNEEGAVIPFPESDEPLVLHFANTAAMAIERARMTRSMILRMIKMAELRDPKETGAHVNRVAAYAVAIYETWAFQKGIRQDLVDANKDVLRMAAMLHDVGKVAISDLILKKPARFTPDEYEIMKGHTFLGARLFSDLYSDFDDSSAIVALSHHERWDGNGYPGHINPFTGTVLPGYETDTGRPLGKKGEEIPVFGRIVAIADVYDALRSKRVYKERWGEEEVLDNLRTESGRQFDPSMIEAFFAAIDMINSISERYPDD